MSLSDLYTRNQGGAFYTPFNNSTINFSYGYSSGGGGAISPVVTAPTFDIKLTLKNATTTPNVFTFNIQNRT